MIPPALLACALNVSPVTLEAVIRVESAAFSFALHVNGLRGSQPRASDAKEAIRAAESYIARGYSVDLGLMQVNSRNLEALGLTIEQALDPCANIRAGGTILAADYARAARQWGEGQPALRAALSAYNSGDFWRGFGNGYVARYLGPGAVPALAGGTHLNITRAAARLAPPDPYTSDQNAYSRQTITFGNVTNVHID